MLIIRLAILYYLQKQIHLEHIVFWKLAEKNIQKIIHVSTDEVYGENLGKPFKEDQNLNPTNPYSASKAAAEMIVNSYKHAYKMNITLIRANNIYGTRQYPEKLISKSLFCFLNKKNDNTWKWEFV